MEQNFTAHKIEKNIIRNRFRNFYKNLNQKQKFAFYFVLCFLLLDLFLGILLFAKRNISSVKLESITQSQVSNLRALNRAARNACISGDNYADFKFTSNQKDIFNKLYNEYGSVALTLRVQIKPSPKQIKENSPADNFKFSFLFSEDFNEKGKFVKQTSYNPKRTQISASEHNIDDKVFDVSFAIITDANGIKEIPEGFEIFSSKKCKILAACLVPVQLGFDFRNSIPFYGFAYNGGSLNFDSRNFDFSGAIEHFPFAGTKSKLLSEFVVGFSSNEEYKSNLDEMYRLDLLFGGERFLVKNVKAAKEVVIPTGAIAKPYTLVSSGHNAIILDSLILRARKSNDEDEILTPVRTDPGLILDYPKENWRTYDYEIFEWDRYPGILFFDTRNYDIQNKFFTRLAFFIEKEGYRGTLLTNRELEGRHGYNAHDYSSESLAKFFNKAIRERFQLNYEEELLARILVKNRILMQDGKYFKALEGGLVSISQESENWRRSSLLAHEGWHTIFFRDGDFRNFVSAIYYTMDPKSRDFIHGFFASQPNLGYDQDDDYLMKNEFMAYVMQQPLYDVSRYFVQIASRGSVMEYIPELSEYIRENEAKTIEDVAIILNDYVFDRFGIVCGNISLVQVQKKN